MSKYISRTGEAIVCETCNEFAQPAFSVYRGIELKPGTQDVHSYLRSTAKSTHHLSCTCTCAMGYGEDSVVDECGRVHEIECLRIVDASVMPSIVSAALNATVIILAEKLSDIISGVKPLAPMYEEASQALAYTRQR